MNTTSPAGGKTQPHQNDEESDIAHLIEHAAHLLPSQGPITVFVHHNSLHAFEDHNFHEGVRLASNAYNTQPYLTESTYRSHLESGRIPVQVLETVLAEDIGEDAHKPLGLFGSRFDLRRAMLAYPLRTGTDEEIRWLVAQRDATRRFLPDVPAEARERIVEQTRQWVRKRKRKDADGSGDPGQMDILNALLLEHKSLGASDDNHAGWEAFSVELLWRICHAGVHGIKRIVEPDPEPIRHRDFLLRATGKDIDLLVHDLLIRFCSSFLDQGFASWGLPERDLGFFHSFSRLYSQATLVEPWLRGLPKELTRIEQAGLTPWACIEESLRLLGVTHTEREKFVQATLLALRGWAGMLWQMETNAEWTVRPAPRGTLTEYLAVRLILERLALGSVVAETLGQNLDLAHLRSHLRHQVARKPRVSIEQRTFLLFQLAQLLGWSPVDLHGLTKSEWSELLLEVESFGSLDRRRVYHLAYERAYRDRALNALAIHSSRNAWSQRQGSSPPAEVPSFQVVTCIDEREESFRRHLEEIEPACETFGVAGFFGVAMYYRGVADAHFRPLCPINIKPRHYIEEEPIYTFEEASRLQAEIRRRLGRFSHTIHRGTRTAIGGLVTTMLGAVAAFPLLMRVLLPRDTARLRRLLGRLVTPPVTQLRIERFSSEPPRDAIEFGFSVPEMADIVGNTLKAIGLTRQMAPLVVFIGHGSSSLNNPQLAAYDCGACGGARGGPNARTFAQMVNDLRVRRILSERGLDIPDNTYFIGAFHNTCDDGLTYFDLDRLPSRYRELFARVRQSLSTAATRNAHERCRRFDAAPLDLTPEEALRHVQARAEDLSQTRPELGHATNALCLVGRRARTRGLFLDRRAFLASYDPVSDPPGSPILSGLLSAVIPVCSGINLEYFFGAIDNIGYGCGTKLPHNVASLLGVMDGAASDLRPGLSWQMVEIHEPMRIVFIVETKPESLAAIVRSNPTIDRLARNEWIQLATLDPDSDQIHVYREGQFLPYEPGTADLPTVPSSVDWYRGHREHLGFASIVAPAHGDSKTGSQT